MAADRASYDYRLLLRGLTHHLYDGWKESVNCSKVIFGGVVIDDAHCPHNS